MDEALLVHRCQTASDLRRNLQRQLYLKLAGAFDETLQRLSLNKLHRVEVTLSASPKMKDRGNIRVTDAGRRTRFA